MNINHTYQGHAPAILKLLPEKSINCVITSPPYYKLWDYQTPPQIWEDGWQGELGQEPRVYQYIRHLIEIFKECKRVLKDDGTMFINLGDTYLKSGSLANTPSRLRIEMTDYLQLIHRNNIVWYKPNKMPESVTNRFTVDFEDILFFTKQEDYYFQQQLEPYTAPMDRWGGDNLIPNGKPSPWDDGTGQTTYRKRNMRPNPDGRNMRTVWKENTVPSDIPHYAKYPPKLIQRMIEAGCPKDGTVLDPFAGAGTTGITARKLGRNFINIELHPDNVKITEDRIDREVGFC